MSILDIFKPRWKHPDPKVRKKVLSRARNKSILRDSMKNDLAPEVCIAAREQLIKLLEKEKDKLSDSITKAYKEISDIPYIQGDSSPASDTSVSGAWESQGAMYDQMREPLDKKIEQFSAELKNIESEIDEITKYTD